MDFLSLMIIYAICFFSSALLVFGGSKDSDIAVVRWLFIYGDKLSSFLWFSIIPGAVRRKIDKLSNWLLYQRNVVFQAIYCLLWLMVFAHFLFEVDPLLRKYGSARGSVVLAYAGFFGNLILFLCCSWTNPGVITRTNHKKFAQVYEYDNQIYKKGVRCTTCEIVKPARSKHCAICDHCVHRFDHHCTWVNSCIGAGNVGYFLLFLLTVTLQCALIAALSTLAMWNEAKFTGLLDAHYVDAENVRRPVNIFIIVQHLFMQRPFIIFITSSLWLLVVLTGGFASYHLFLACTNQTTNERYKLPGLHRQQKGHRKDRRGKGWIYSRGPWRNLREVLLGIR